MNRKETAISQKVEVANAILRVNPLEAESETSVPATASEASIPSG